MNSNIVGRLAAIAVAQRDAAGQTELADHHVVQPSLALGALGGPGQGEVVLDLQRGALGRSGNSSDRSRSHGTYP